MKQTTLKNSFSYRAIYLLGNIIEKCVCLWFFSSLDVYFVLFCFFFSPSLCVYADDIWQAYYFVHVQSINAVYLLSHWLVFLILLSTKAGHYIFTLEYDVFALMHGIKTKEMHLPHREKINGVWSDYHIKIISTISLFAECLSKSNAENIIITMKSI